MNINTIVYKGNISGIDILIKWPNSSDAEIMCKYINTLSEEKTFIRFQGEKISLEEEIKYLKSQLEKIAKKKALTLLVFSHEKLIGISDINMRDKIERHIGVLGITIVKDFRGKGIGSLLMKYVIEQAIENISQLEIVILGVFSNNQLARKMYKKFGFKEYSVLPKGVKLENTYVDHIEMYKNVKN